MKDLWTMSPMIAPKIFSAQVPSRCAKWLRDLLSKVEMQKLPRASALIGFQIGDQIPVSQIQSTMIYGRLFNLHRAASTAK